jgi:hypothetical protein
MMVDKSRQILIEGIDLVGKSTLSEMISVELGVKLFRNSWVSQNEFFDRAKKLLNLNSKSKKGGDLLIKAIIYEISAFPELTSFLMDSSTYFRSLAYHEAIKNYELVDKLLSILDIYPRFDNVVLVRADLNIRKKRLYNRIDNNLKFNKTDIIVENNPILSRDMEISMEKFIKLSYSNYVIIDTTQEDIEKSFLELKNKLGV